MEIEAKFFVPHFVVARRLNALDALGEFTLSPAQVVRVRDTFFDTRARALLAARYALRVRRQDDDQAFVTVKTPAQQRGAVHRRPETEVQVAWARAPRQLMPTNLPARIRSVLRQVVGNEPLYPLWTISQTRHVRVMRAGQRVVAEWSLDRVQFRAGARRKSFYELEIELKKTGTERDLAQMIESLTREWNLEPQPQSKFERAREFMRGRE